MNLLRGDALVAIRQRLGVSVVPGDLVGQCSIGPARAARRRAATEPDNMVRPGRADAVPESLYDAGRRKLSVFLTGYVPSEFIGFRRPVEEVGGAVGNEGGGHSTQLDASQVVFPAARKQLGESEAGFGPRVVQPDRY